jgi:hypothetical protein
MPKKEDMMEEVPARKKSDREIRWEQFVAAYAISNPVKYAGKKANGEFEKIPDSFK